MSSITIPVKELSRFLAEMQLDSSKGYEVTFHLAGDGMIHNFCLVANERPPRVQVPSPPPTVEDRTLKAELTLRRIALACLHARTTKDFESAVSNIVAAHTDWVADKVDVAAYRAMQGGSV